MAGEFVAASLVIGGVLVISTDGLLLITAFVDKPLVLAMLSLLELAGGSLDVELVEPG
jgi:hypothetical protein